MEKQSTMGCNLNENGITDFAQYILDDGQSLRPFHNYISETFDGVKQKELSFEGITFTDRIEFYKHIIGCLEFMIQSTNEWKLDCEEEYLESNKL